MKSAAVVFLDMFGITPILRPSKVEGVLISLLHTLNKADLLDAAISDIHNYADARIEHRDGLEYVKQVTSTPEVVGLYNKPKAMQLLLLMLPDITLVDEYGVITVELPILERIINRTRRNHKQAEIKKILKQINNLNLGYKVIQLPNENLEEFHIVKYTTRKELLSRLTEHKLQNPSILDRVM